MTFLICSNLVETQLNLLNFSFFSFQDVLNFNSTVLLDHIFQGIFLIIKNHNFLIGDINHLMEPSQENPTNNPRVPPTVPIRVCTLVMKYSFCIVLKGVHDLRLVAEPGEKNA